MRRGEERDRRAASKRIRDVVAGCLALEAGIAEKSDFAQERRSMTGSYYGPRCNSHQSALERSRSDSDRHPKVTA